MPRLRPFAAFLALAALLCLLGLWSARTQTGGLRRVTTTTEEGININPSLSGDGRRIAFESTEDLAHAGGTDHFRALRADVASDPPVFTQISGTRAPAPGISQDGSRIAFAAKDDPLGTNADGNSEIFYYDGASLRQITNTTPADMSTRTRDGNFQPSLSDDGRFIAFSSNRNLANQNADGNLEIFVFDTLANTFTQLTNAVGTVGSTDAKISGDGSRIAYIRDNNATPSAQRDLILRERTTFVDRLLMSDVLLAFTYGRAMSDDGTRVVFSARDQVFLYDGRTGNTVRQITTLGVRDTDVPLHPTISGDGSRIAFATRRPVTGISNSDNSIELYTYDIPTGQFARVTNAPSNADGFDGSSRVAEVVSSLSDDGSVVAFNFPRSLSGAVTSGLENNSEIYVTATAPRPTTGTLTVLNGASFGNEPSTIKAVAPDSIAIAQGGALAFSTEQPQKQSDGSFPTTVAGTTVKVNNRPAQIFFVSPTQVNFLVPPQTELGTAEVVITNSEGFQSRGNVTTLRAAPGIFTFSGDGRGEAIAFNADTLQSGPFDPSSGNLRLVIFTTGVRNASQVTATAGGRALTVESFLASPDMPGLDEVRVKVPADLRGAGTVDLVVRADNRDSNPATIIFTGDARRDILINEVLADPPDGAAGDANHDGVRDSSDDEFVELVNTTSSDIQIGGFQLLTRSTGSTSDTVRHTFPAGTIFPAGTAIVVFGGGTFNPSDPVFGGAQVVKASSGGLSLTNSGGVVTLRDTSQAIVNIFSYGGSTGLNGDANQSLTRAPDITGNFAPHTTAPGSQNRAYSPGTHVDGTPFGGSPIARIEVTPASATVDAGAKQQFTARAFNSNNQEVSGVIFIWQSSDTSVATIDQNGLATSLQPGTTEIRATGRGVTSGPATLTVQAVERILTRVEVTPSTATIPVSGTQQFTARGFDQFDNEIAGLTFTWDSTNPSVATVDQTGLAAGVAQGQATIRATSQNLTGTATLNVTPATVVINEVLADPPGSATTDTQGDANHDGTRSSGDDEFVEFANATNAGIGISGWTLRTRATGGTTETIRHTFAANTTLPAGEAIVVFGGGTFNPSDSVFRCAQVLKASTGGLSLTNSGLTVILRDSSGNLITQFTYGGTGGLSGDSDQSLTRSPDITGNFALHSTAAGAGGRKFSPGTRVDGTAFGNCPARLTSVTIAPASSTVIIGQSTQFTAQAFDQFGQAMTNVTITFASDNTSAATVDSVTTDPNTGIATATVTGHSQGTAHITAQATDGTTTLTSSQATLSVIPPQPVGSRVDVTPQTATINRGQTQQFTAAAFDQDNQPFNGGAFTWSSSNTNVATIDANGLAHGVGIGTATITATTSNGVGGMVSGTATLNVQVPLVINEISADVAPDNVATAAVEGDANRDGVRDSDDDEFVELLNNSNAAVDISGIVIADGTSNRFTVPANTTLASGRALVIFGGGSINASDPAFGGALVLAVSGSGTLSLNDGGDTVNVKLNVGGSDVLIATQSYGGSSGVTAPSDQATTRSPDAEVGTGGGNFIPHNTATNAAGRTFSPGTRADGTPFGSPAITRIDVTPATATLDAGQTQSFTARAFSNVGGPEVEVQNVSFIWDSSDTAKATVAPTTGPSTTATAVSPGSATIRARAGGQQNTAALTINTPVSLSINDASASEGNAGTTTFTFTVSLNTPAHAGGVTFDIATQDGTATTADNDYIARSLLAQTIPAGQQTYTFDVSVNGDTAIEPNETFLVNVTNVSGATVADGQGQGTILSDDSPVLSIDDVTLNEGNTGTTTYTFTVSLTQPAPAGGVTFDIATQDGTATAGSDYAAKSLSAQTIPAGQQAYTFDVAVNGDTLVEPDETFFVNVSNVSGATVADGQGTGTITNDDAANLVISQVYGGGNNGGAPYQNDFVELFNHGTTTIDFAVTPYSIQYASVGSSFGANKTNLTSGTIAPGHYFLVQESGGTTNGVALPAPDATGTIALAAASGKVALVAGTTALPASACPGDDGASPFNPADPVIADFVGYGSTAGASGHCYEGAGPAAAPGNATADLRKNGGCTDTNNNAADFIAFAPSPRNTASPVNSCLAGTPPTLSINDVTVTEGNSGTVTATFTVSLSAPAPSTDITFDIATANNTATVANNDYVARSLTNQIIPAGQQTYTFSVTVNGDTAVEPDETFFVNVSNVSGASVGDAQGQGTIQNDDLPTLSVNDVSLSEGNTGATTFTFTVSLSAPAPSAVTFDIATADGTAQDGNPAGDDNDYVARSLTGQTIAAGQQTYTFDVTVNGDTTIEPNETFLVNVSNVSGASVVDAQGQGTIQNDDSPPTLSINDVTANEGNTGTTTFTFTVSLSSPALAGGVTFDIATQDNTATTAGNDYVARSLTAQTIPEGGQTFTFDVAVNGDTLFEPSETFFVNVTNVSGATVTDGQGTGTITNDDAQPTLSITDASVTEGNSGTSLMTFTVTLTGTSQSAVSVNYATADSSATVAGGDYDSASGTLNFAPGDTSKTFTVTVHGDTVAEGDEMFLANLSGASGATISDAQGLGTIFLDDPFSIAAVNTAYTENFDVLAQSGASSTTPPAWTRAESGTSANTTYTANDGGSATGDSYSYGTTASSDRALGGLQTGSLVPTVGAFYRNDTGVTITTLQVAYTGEEWRLGTAGRTDRLDFQYSTNATSLTTGTWTDVDALDFTTPNTTTTGAKDGNNVANRTPLSTIITGLSIAPGATLWLRWTDLNATNSDDGLAVDDFSITANVNIPALSINDVAANEGNAGTTTYTFTVSLSQPAGAGGVTFDIATADNTATVADNDYVARSLTGQTILQGQQTYTFDVTVNGDTNIEPNETFFVNVTNVSGATVSDGQGTGTITSDDAATFPQPTAGQVIINEALIASSTTTTTRPDFLELYNTTNQTLDISGMVISFRPGGAGNTPSTVTLPGAVGSGTTTIAANSYFIIVNGASVLNGSGVAVSADYNAGSGNFDLNGTGGGIKIEVNGVKLDGLTYQGSATAINATFVAYGEGSIFTFASATTNDLVRSSTSADTNNNLNDFRHLSSSTTITPKAVNPP